MHTKVCGHIWTPEIYTFVGKNMKMCRKVVSCGDVEWIYVVQNSSRKQRGANLNTEHFLDKLENYLLLKKTAG
jgi:hypothetical protein